MEENKIVTLKLIDFNESERNNLQAILTLASRVLKKKWLVVTTNEADFFLFSVSAATKLNSEGLPPERCMFCTTSEMPTQAHSLLVDKGHLPRLSALVSLFNRLTTKPEASVAIQLPELSESAPSPLPQQEQTICEENFFDPQKGLLGHLLDSGHEQLIISLNDQPDYAPLYIDAEKNAYYSQNSLTQLEPYLLTPEALSINPSSNIEVEKYIAAENLQPYPLKDLIWYITIKTSAGRVMKNHANADIVALKNWPDLRLFKCLDYAKLAAFMKNNAAPLEIIAEQTRVALSEVNTFYNACYLIGLIEKRNQIEINKKSITSERLSLLTKIDARLK